MLRRGLLYDYQALILEFPEFFDLIDFIIHIISFKIQGLTPAS
jgi:hypothetical protein